MSETPEISEPNESEPSESEIGAWLHVLADTAQDPVEKALRARRIQTALSLPPMVKVQRDRARLRAWADNMAERKAA